MTRQRCPAHRAWPIREDGSIIPLILGFFLVALMMVAGSVLVGQSFQQQRGLQSVCDGAAAAAAASAADLDRGGDLGTGPRLRFADVRRAVATYLARDPNRADVTPTVGISPDATRLRLRCVETMPVAFGAMFGRSTGVTHTVHSSARAPLS